MENLNLVNLLLDIEKETEKFNKKTKEMIKSLMDTQKRKLDEIKKLKVAAIATEYCRKQQRIFLKSTVELESRLQEAQGKLNTANVNFTL